MKQNGWQEGNLPPQSGVYLVKITPIEGWELGFGNHPPILVASYTKSGNKWAPHGALIQIPDFAENINSWHELPPE
jgi:hypothetical protein